MHQNVNIENTKIINSNIFHSNESTPQFIQFNRLIEIDFINHCFSTRLGGVSKGIYESLNLSFDRGDEKEQVISNYSILCDQLGVQLDSLVHSHQIHDNKIHVVTKEDCGNDILRESSIIGYDGFITNIPGITLLRSFADCVPLYFVDTKHKAIGLSHSGWRGTVKKIGAATLEEMNKHYGTEPKDVIAAIGPSICQSCYEVSEDVYDEFQTIFSQNEMNKIAYSTENHKYQLNLQKANQLILEQAGVSKENIIVTDLCTCCKSDIFFSHRASKGQRGGLIAMLTIKES